MRIRRPFAARARALGALAHHSFETRAGVGLVFEPELGRRGAYRALGRALPGDGGFSAARGGSLNERLSAVNAGIGAAGVAVHFAAWPWSLHGGVPMLDEAEGLTEEQLPAYNAVLWFWLLSSVAQPRPRGRSALAAARTPRRPGQFPDPALLRPPPLPLGEGAGRAGPSAGARRCANEPGILALSFDNLGEAAEIELGAVAPDDPGVGSHFTATEVLPALLDRLEDAGVSATFFVEGLNTEIYPDRLREIAARGHEVGFHAWRHEEWASFRSTSRRPT